MISISSSREKSSFNDRLKIGLSFESRVERLFKKLGVSIYPYGLGTLPTKAKELLLSQNDPTSLLLRFTPDFFIIAEANTHFIECKTAMTLTPNYTYNLGCYQAGLKLADIGIKIMAVFGDKFCNEIHCEWIHKLKPSQICEEGSPNGSGKPYILIAKSDLPDLYSFLKSEKIIDAVRGDFRKGTYNRQYEVKNANI